MKNMQEILNNLPKTWLEINKEEYPMFGVYSNPEIETVGAYKTNLGNVVTINLYTEKNFIDLYDSQMKEIASVLNGKNWKEISSINPLNFGHIEHEKCKLYFSVYEVSSTSDVVALQMFFEQENTIGFLSAIKKPKEFTFDYLLKNEDVVKNIFNCIK